MEYTVIKQNRKTAAISIDDDLQVMIKVPKHMTQKDIRKLMIEHEAWILKTVAQKRLHNETCDWYKTGKVLYFGEYWQVRVEQVITKKSSIMFNQQEGFTIWSKGEEEARRLMEYYYREQAKHYLAKLVQQYAKVVDIDYQKITIRKQVTRWGSCSARGNLSFNLKILCAPHEMIDYVVLHEVMHLKHFNHSQSFWKAIEEIMPDYKKRMNYFKQFGQNFII